MRTARVDAHEFRRVLVELLCNDHGITQEAFGPLKTLCASAYPDEWGDICNACVTCEDGRVRLPEDKREKLSDHHGWPISDALNAARKQPAWTDIGAY